MTIRSLTEQFEEQFASRVHLLAEAASALRISGRASSYYLLEIAHCLDSGLFLGSIHLAVSLSEIHVRDLLVYYLATQMSTGGQVSWRDSLCEAEREIEGVKRGLSFQEMLAKLVHAKVVSVEDTQNLLSFYQDVRNPIQHGLTRRLLYGNGSYDWFLRLESPDRRTDELDKFITERAETVVTVVVNFIASGRIPAVPRQGLVFHRS